MQLRDFLPSEQLVSSLLDALPDALVVVDSSGRILAANAAALRLFDYSASDLVGRSVEMLIPEPLREPHERARHDFAAQPVARSMAQGRDLTGLRRDGTELSLQIALSPLQAQDHALVLVTLRETPDYVRALRETEARYRSAIEQAPDAVFVADLNGRYTDVNSAACKMLGYSREQLVGKTIMDLIPAEDLPRLVASRDKLLASGAGELGTWSLIRADGTRLPVEVSALIHADGRWQAFVRDISERKHAEAALALALRELETVLETLPDPIAIRIGCCYAYVNPAWLRVLGYSRPDELLGKSVLDGVHPDDRARVSARFVPSPAQDSAESVEIRMLAKDGSTVPLDFPPSVELHYRGQPARLVVAHDRREEKRLAAVFAARERLVTVGTLAAGVGHEINNPLQHVTMNLELLRDEIAGAAEISAENARGWAELTSAALHGAERIRKIVLDLRTFSRGERDQRSTVDARDVLELALNLARHELRHRTRIEREFGPIPRVVADESRLAQVFINLLVNAVQAMAKRPQETNLVRLATRTDAQGRAVVEVSDNGPGIAPDVYRHIFEPFFSTKPVGDGAGLGLAVSYNIVTALDGQIECDSEPGVGTTFRVVLPPALAVAVASEPPSSATVASRGKVLVVEDEAVLARLLERVLEREHEVTVAEHGMRALALLKSGQDYDVVLCDMMMPHMNGMELYERVKQEKPEVAERFVFMTGGATRCDTQAFLDSVPNEKLYKPFSAPSAQAVVNRLLQARAARLQATGSEHDQPGARLAAEELRGNSG